ncbi:alanine-glyoxylate amino-transferase [Leptospira inadai serovar Lyme str. 10]|uniref:Alanine-glyoxylate amino-transferase n=2 Tax=Leptospira inadai serovar Lyme TaxID=293084 RepID=V6H9G9_9LEPT|nr:PLP-dependent aminotransferase family protein [Leptospira inadai]EQA35622.1 alanine-glyoxylate amino-transferase [Leptospira inadai serovar Lyme str. 10]PNV73956.1 transcriptional regulator [Leptospira inadai serovar Lyme]
MGKSFTKSLINSEGSIRSSSRVARTPESVIRDILKVINDSDILSFAGGLPDDSLFPIEDFSDGAALAIRESGAKLFQYSETQGHPKLRAWIAESYYPQSSPEEILLTNGSQQALDLLGRFFLDEGDSILIERPSYLGAIQTFSSYGPRFIGLDYKSEGPDPSELKAQISRNHNPPKFFYCIPDFQNPTGFSYSLQNRKAIARICEEAGIPVLEDVAYRELNYENEIPISLHMLCPENTFSIGTFSKILAPGLRVGWIRAPKELMRELIVQKQAMDLHSPLINQEIVYQFLISGNFRNHLIGLKENYSRKAKMATEMFLKTFGGAIRLKRPLGGLFLWVEFLDKTDTNLLFKTALEEGVAIVPGDTFFTDESSGKQLRWNFSRANTEEMEIGANRLFKAWKRLHSIRK